MDPLRFADDYLSVGEYNVFSCDWGQVNTQLSLAAHIIILTCDWPAGGHLLPPRRRRHQAGGGVPRGSW